MSGIKLAYTIAGNPIFCSLECTLKLSYCNMLKSLFTTAIRNLLRNPFFSFINIFGLSAGLSAFLLLFLYVYNEITYDRFHTRHDRIYRLLENEMEYTKGLTLPYLTENFPEIERCRKRW